MTSSEVGGEKVLMKIINSIIIGRSHYQPNSNKIQYNVTQKDTAKFYQHLMIWSYVTIYLNMTYPQVQKIEFPA